MPASSSIKFRVRHGNLEYRDPNPLETGLVSVLYYFGLRLEIYKDTIDLVENAYFSSTIYSARNGLVIYRERCKRI